MFLLRDEGNFALSEGIGRILTPSRAAVNKGNSIAKPAISVSNEINSHENLHANELRPEQHPDTHGTDGKVTNRKI